MLQGTIGLLLFNSEGDIQQLLHLSAKGPTHGIEGKEDQFHTLMALEANKQEAQWRNLLSVSGLA